MPKKLRAFITPWNIIILSILFLSFVIRIYNIDKLLAFHFDQGRDALVIWDLLNNGHWFLIGPTTGIAGIFRGPLYYYLIAPFYYIGIGNPIFPSIFLIFTSVIALCFLYKITLEISSKTSGLIALILAGFSYEMIYASRWLSNPTPMLLLSMLLIWSILKIYNGNKKYWMLVGLTLGLSLFHFGSSGEIFYFPAIIFLILTNKKMFPDKSTLIKSIVLFAISFSPLLIFDLRHGGLLRKNILGFLSGGETFTLPSISFIFDRMFLIFNYFLNLLFHEQNEIEKLLVILFVILSICFIKKIINIFPKFKLILVFILAPVVGMLFFQGNFGNVYGYYLTGYYLIFIILASVVLGYIFNSSILGKIFTTIFLVIFLKNNLVWTIGYINENSLNENVIVLSTQVKAIDWIYKDAATEKFNVDIYVPPVIPYSYDYLFTWKYNPQKISENVPRLYTLYEVDPSHPERLDAWLKRQEGIGKVIEEHVFGGIHVQERIRLK